VRRRYILLLLVIFFTNSIGLSADLDLLLKAVRHVDAKGSGHREALAAVKQLAERDIAELTTILAAMDDANPLAENWLHGAAQSVVDRAQHNDQQLPWDALEQFLNETNHNPKARRWAYDLIRQHDPTAEQRFVLGWVNDPSLPLRRDAIELLLKTAATKSQMKQDNEALQLYRQAFVSARDLDQIEKIVEQLKARGDAPDVVQQMGFVVSWKLIGPYDNTNKRGFDAVYSPEKEIDLTKPDRGKNDKQVQWIDHTTSDPFGNVDLNTAVGKNMGAVAYAFTEFWSKEPQEVEVRIGSTNGNKVWLNGELLTANHVYHSNTFIDQYIGRGKLKAGRNEILVKVAQNEQTEDWAQNWQFQLRVCDKIGTAVLSQARVE